MDDNVVCITQLSCINKFSPITDYIYPPNLNPEKYFFPLEFPGIDFAKGIASTEDEYRECISLLPHFAFADMNFSMTADVLYMILPASTGKFLYAISYYRRFNSFHVKGNVKVPVILWKSVCLLFKIPFFGAVSARLKPVVLSHFTNIASPDMNMLEDAFHHINNSLNSNNFQYEDLFFDLSNNEKSAVMIFNSALLSLLVKSILLERRIVLYSKSAFSVSSNILAILGLIPAALTLGFPAKNFGRDYLTWQRYGLPLKIFHENNPLMLLCPRNMIGVVSTKKSYLIGITDFDSFEKLEKPVDMLIDLDNTLINICNYNIYWITYLTFHEECFFISSIFDEDLFKDVICAAKESSRIAINLIRSAVSKLPASLISLARFSIKNKNDSLDHSENDERESIVEFFDKLFPGATPRWLKKAIDITSPKPVRKSKQKLQSDSFRLPYADTMGILSNRDKNDKSDRLGEQVRSNMIRSRDKSDRDSNKVNNSKLSRSIAKSNSKSSENELKTIAEFESRIRLLNEYVFDLLHKIAYIATNEREINYISAIVDFDLNKSVDGIGYMFISMRTLDMDVQNELSIELKKIRLKNDNLTSNYVVDSSNSDLQNKIYEKCSDGGSIEEFNPNKSEDTKNVKDLLPDHNKLNGSDLDPKKFHNIHKIDENTDKSQICANYQNSTKIYSSDYELSEANNPLDRTCHTPIDFDDEVQKNRFNDIKYKYIQRYIPELLADQIYETQNDFSYAFLKYWIDTTNARQFIETHNLPEFSLSNADHAGTYGKIKTFTYSNGDEYKGTTRHMLRHGQGKYLSKKGTIYEGEWKKDKRDGHGVLKSMNPLFYYSGNWKCDMKNGFGHLKTEFMEYWGQFKDNQFNGSGIIVQCNGTTYEGEFKDGRFHGQGKLLERGLIKLGEFNQGTLVGTASVIYQTGCIYIGNVEHDIPNGMGYMCYDDDHNFHGSWINGIRFGQGVLCVRYTGNHEDKDLKIPEEQIYTLDTTTYKLKQATMALKTSQQTFTSGWTIEGNWKDDNINLTYPLTILFPNGDKYIGSMSLVDIEHVLKLLDKDNPSIADKVLLPQGKGMFKCASTGEVYDGEWHMGFSHGHGKFLLKEGISWDGELNMNLFGQCGKLTLNDGENIDLNLKLSITREQLIEIGNTRAIVELSNKHIKCANSPFLETCLKYNLYEVGFMMKSKVASDIYGELVRYSLTNIGSSAAT